MLIKLTSRNQFTIPESLINSFKNIDYFNIEEKDGCIVLHPIQMRNLIEVRSKLEAIGIRDDGVKDAVEWARK